MPEPITRPEAVPPVVRASSGTRVRSARDPGIGDGVEGYELLSLLSSGETLVFVARRTEDERRVVLRLPSARGEDKAVALVANEATFGTRVDTLRWFGSWPEVASAVDPSWSASTSAGSRSRRCWTRSRAAVAAWRRPWRG